MGRPEAADATQLTALEPGNPVDDPPTYTYTCAVVNGVLKIVETSTEDSTDAESVNVGFTRTGAMSWTTSDYLGGGRLKRDDLRYGRRTVKAPKHTNIISAKRWTAAVKQATN